MSKFYTTMKSLALVAMVVFFTPKANADAPSFTCSPSQGSVYILELVEMTFSSTVEVVDASKIYFEGHEDMKVDAFVPEMETSHLVLGFDRIKVAGSYNLVVGAGAISVGGTVTDADCVARYNVVVGGNWTGKVTINPAEGVVESLSSFTAYYEKASNVGMSNSAGPSDFPMVYKLKKDGSRGNSYMMRASTGTNSLKMNLHADITDSGKYELVIPATCVFVDGEDVTEAHSFFYTIEGETGLTDFEYTYSVIPDNKEAVSSLPRITVNFDGVSSIEQADPFTWSLPTIHKVDEDGNNMGYPFGLSYIISGTQLVATLGEYSQIEDEGRYKLTIPGEFLKMTSQDGTETMLNDKIEIFYDFVPKSDGVESVVVNVAADGNIYEINGIRVDAKGRQLPTGAYIINGKKVLVK